MAVGVVTTVRLPRLLVKRLNKTQREYNKKFPGSPQPGKSAFLRFVLHEGLKHIEERVK